MIGAVLGAAAVGVSTTVDSIALELVFIGAIAAISFRVLEVALTAFAEDEGSRGAVGPPVTVWSIGSLVGGLGHRGVLLADRGQRDGLGRQRLPGRAADRACERRLGAGERLDRVRVGLLVALAGRRALAVASG